MTRDWLDGQCTIPLHVGVARTVIFGKTPVKFGVEINYYVERPEAFGPRWMFSFNITPVVPNIVAAWLKLN